ncbi:MAG: type II toxin-antitoxin system VapC family toxin [Gemmatimonadales bacterium]|nr:type II toxin-antitoxin system VapC family toxin [Gemmatimonadales bacterium]
MKFWDSSAIAALLLQEPRTNDLLAILDADRVVVAWWGTPVECTAAVARRERERALTVAAAGAALARLRMIASAWQEILPEGTLRAVAERLVRVHPLRSADSLQLAAAIVAAGHEPATLEFVSLDQRLNEAAAREGFVVLPA